MTQNYVLKVGAGKSIIQYPNELFPTPLEVFDGVHDHPSLRVVVIEYNKRVAIINIESVNLFGDARASVVRKVAEITGVDPEDVWYHNSHVLSTPHVWSLTSKMPPRTEEDTVKIEMLHKYMIQAAEEAAGEAVERMREADYGFGIGCCEANANRNIPTARGWSTGANDEGAVDHEVPIIRFDDKNGEPIAILFYFNAQPSVLDQTKNEDGTRWISGDIAGYSSAFVEREFPGSVAMYCTGAGGDEGPYLRGQYTLIGRNGREIEKDLHEKAFLLCELLGERIGMQVVMAAERIQCKPMDAEIRLVRRVFHYEGQEMARGREPVKEFAYQSVGDRTLEFSVLQIGDIALVGLVPEICARTEMKIRKEAPFKNVAVSTFTGSGPMESGNGKYLGEADYYDSITFQAVSSAYAKGTAERLVEDVKRVMSEMQKGEGGILHMTTVTEPSFDGQRICGAIIEFDKELSCDSFKKEMISIREAPILDCYVSDEESCTGRRADGRFVIVSLSSEDESTRLMQKVYIENRGPGGPGGPGGPKGPGGPGGPKGPGGPGGKPGGKKYIGMKKQDVRLHLTLREQLPCADKTFIAPFGGEYLGDRELDLVVNRFEHRSFKDLEYNLFVPDDYDSGKKYPMLLFIPDAEGNGPEADRTLIQGMGATIWASDEEQKKHPCIIIAPQINGEPLTNNDHTCSPLLDTIKELLDEMEKEYSIDENRRYTTGQSQGCMASFELNLRYPDYFAASLLVSGHWDEDRIAEKLADKKLLICLSEGGIGEFDSMSKVYEKLKARGADVIERKFFDARQSSEELNKDFREFLAHRANIKMAVYTKESSLPDDGKTYFNIIYHQRGWEITYPIEAVRDWLFAQIKE